MNSLPPEMLLAIFENLDSVQQQAIMRTCRSWMELLRQKCSRTIKLDLDLHRGKKLPLQCTSLIDFFLQDRIRHPVINTSGEPRDLSLSDVDTIYLTGAYRRIGQVCRPIYVRRTFGPDDIEECGCYGVVTFRKPIKLILENMEMDWACLEESPGMFAKCGQIVVKNFRLTDLLLEPKFPSSEANVSLESFGLNRHIDFLQIDYNQEAANVVPKEMLKKLNQVEKEEWGANAYRSFSYYSCNLEDLSYYLKPSGPSYQSGQVLENELQRLGLVETTLDWNSNFRSQSTFVRCLLRVSFVVPSKPYEESESSDDNEEEEVEWTDDDDM